MLLYEGILKHVNNAASGIRVGANNAWDIERKRLYEVLARGVAPEPQEAIRPGFLGQRQM